MSTYSGNPGRRVRRRHTNLIPTLLVFSLALNLMYALLVTSALNQTEEAIQLVEEYQQLLQLTEIKQQEYSEAELGSGYPYEEREAYVDYVSAEYLANVTWGEARGCSVTEQAAVMWCVLNRVDHPSYPDTVAEVVTQRKQFDGYSEDNPITDELLQLANRVMWYWHEGDDSGRVLPKEYIYFLGDGKHNHFYTTWATDETPWDWSLPSVYEEVHN